MFSKFVILAILSLAVLTKADEDSAPSQAEDVQGRARIVVAKQIQNKYLVEGMDTVVKYSLYNIGDAAAVDIQVTDAGFAKDDFEVSGGLTSFQLDRLAPKANNSHTIVVKPLKYGYFNFTAAEVKYKDNEDPAIAVSRLVFSSEPGQGAIVALRDYERQFSAHMFDWLVFGVMSLPSLAIPFFLWHNSKSKYESLAKSKKD